MEYKIKAFARTKQLLMISFLFGLLCLFMGVFGNWNNLTIGIGAALAFQSALMLIIGLLNNFQREFYLHHLKKSNQN